MAIVVADLTSGTVAGNGVFDKLMQVMKAHLLEEVTANRIKGAEYATVYLGALNSVMAQSLEFLLQQEKVALENLLIVAQTAKVSAEKLLVDAETGKVASDILMVSAQKDVAVQQKTNLIAEALLIPKQGLKLDAELLLIPKEGLKLDQEVLLVTAQVANAALEGDVLTAQKCKLQAEFDFTAANTLRVGEEKLLITQRKVTEAAQTSSTAIDAGSVLGKQITLYTNQAAGFLRDAEQKAAQILLDTFNVRQSTVGSVQVNNTNKLDDANIGPVILKLIQGVTP